MRFSDKIMTLRKQRGWSQEELANQLDVSRQAIYKWESGLTTPELEKIKKLTEIFDTTFEELLNDEKELSLNKKEVDEPIIEESAPRTKYHYAPSESTKKKDESISPNNKKGKPIVFIIIGAVALVLLITALILVLRFCSSDNDDDSESSSESSSEESSSSSVVVGANCTIQIKTGKSEDIQYRVKLTKGESFEIEVPELTRDCVYFDGYYTEDNVKITGNDGVSVVKWQGEQMYVLYPHYEYAIRTVDDLIALQNFAPARRQDTYKGVRITLKNDLDLSKVQDWEPLRVYACFDGQGHKIKNLKSTKGGLFADIYGSDDKYIKNLTLENVSISISELPSSSTSMYVGVLAGWFQGRVEGVKVKNAKITIAKGVEGCVLCDDAFNELIVYHSRTLEDCESNATIEIK